MRKEELRQQIRQQKRQFTPEQLRELSLPVLARLRPLLAEASVIMAYYSLPDEVCTHQLIDELVAEGKTVLLPKVIDGETMELRRYTGRDDLEEGAYHILEPVGELFKDYASIDVVLVPGLAFDAAGHRLGRGRGYYDRFLEGTDGTDPNADVFDSAEGSVPRTQVRPVSKTPRTKTLGLCFDFQKVDVVPTDAHDRAVDIVV